MRPWVVLFVPLVLMSCVSQRERQEEAAEYQKAMSWSDDAQCLSLGVPKGSQPYVACRLQIAHDRSVSAAMAEAQRQENARQMLITGAALMQGN